MIKVQILRVSGRDHFRLDHPTRALLVERDLAPVRRATVGPSHVRARRIRDFRGQRGLSFAAGDVLYGTQRRLAILWIGMRLVYRCWRRSRSHGVHWR